MNHDQLKNLEDKLWNSANAMRAHGGLKASDYAVPVLGLIFLKFAENKYSQHEAKILADYQKDKGTRMERTIQEVALATCGFYLPENARYDHLLKLPGNKRAEALRDAMKGIEKYQDAKFQDVLPTEAYFEIEKKKDDILPELLKSFSDIPKDASGDIFGKIYEYFLGKFAMSEGQKGGEFFTPTSVVRFIVELIEPYKGKIYDPACGSGGMFVQSADFIAHEGHDLNDIYVYGQEYMGETVRLAKMNLLVHNLRGEITEANSYDSDPYDGFGKFDFVMANPPFNVKSVKESTVKNDERFYKYGLPKNKGKKDDKISDANYLWISLFATSLNKNGRAGFVMPNSASDARNSEYDIRKNIVDSGIVDCMVSMPTNMFLTVTLPATLWFFDKQKVNTERKDKILFLDARNVYNQIDRAHREWTQENQQNLAAIVRLYRGETNRYLQLIDTYIKAADQAEIKIEPAKEALVLQIEKVIKSLKKHIEETKDSKRTPAKTKALKETNFFNLIENFKRTTPQANKEVLNNLAHPIKSTQRDNEEQLQVAEHLQWNVAQNKLESDALKQDVNTLLELYKIADKNLKLKTDKVWSNYDLVKADKNLEEALQLYLESTEYAAYWVTNIYWLQSRFPEAKYEDVVGLCKMADRTEYVEEQDYSLNAGRYVGVEIEEISMSIEEYTTFLKEKNLKFKRLGEESLGLENKIELNLKSLLYEIN
ncbi:class I SAM-dependent DNA methyltransferase [Dokdonia sp. Hel_I_53]|uniref:type I restriction-modification system subunit M n=1 Tax=Dokdonia sp. Hel_I_53 TaxID=1566287 RepID=UPI00119B0EF9|nr:class I SAM-dependent DNA methyltransferase [Dokdonia sp. Hel_I_53]TVZ51524.1 type I restriction enzyme M protein [Dokdonia sp. Hel_I_53]